MTPDPGRLSEVKLPLHKKIALKVMAAFSNSVMLPAMQWVAKGQFEAPARPVGPAGEAVPYVESVDYIDPMILMAAQQHRGRDAQADPVGYQSVLNACMEGVRADGIKDPMIRMYGSLIGRGYPPDEAMVRVSANFVHLGMYLERRLALRFENEPAVDE